MRASSSAIGATDAIDCLTGRAISVIGRLVMPARRGTTLRWPGHSGPSAEVDEAEDAAQQAVALLESLPPGRELAGLLRTFRLVAVFEEPEDADAWGTRGLELARRLEDDETSVHALVNTAAAQFP